MNVNFQFENLSDFVSMSGHGPFVWVCYFITAVAIGYLLINPLLSKKRILKNLAQQQRLERARPRGAVTQPAPEQQESK